MPTWQFLLYALVGFRRWAYWLVPRLFPRTLYQTPCNCSTATTSPTQRETPWKSTHQSERYFTVMRELNNFNKKYFGPKSHRVPPTRVKVRWNSIALTPEPLLCRISKVGCKPGQSCQDPHLHSSSPTLIPSPEWILFYFLSVSAVQHWFRHFRIMGCIVHHHTHFRSWLAHALSLLQR